MRFLKIILIVLLVAVGALYLFTEARDLASGADVPPVIQCDSDLLEISVSQGEEALLAGVHASDQQDGDLTDKILLRGLSKLVSNDTAKVSYIVFDSDGNAATVSRMVRYTDYEKPHFTLEKALIYTENQDIRLLDRLTARDTIDGDITDAIRVSAMSATDDPEIQTVSVQVTNSMGDTAQLQLPIVTYSGVVVRPTIELSDYLVYVAEGNSFDPYRYVIGIDTPIGAGDVDRLQVTSQVDTTVPGTYYVYYRYPYSITVAVSILTVVVE